MRIPAPGDFRIVATAIPPGRGDALVGKEMVTAAIEATRDFVDSTYRPAAKIAARGGNLKEAWHAVRDACDAKFKDYAKSKGGNCIVQGRLRTMML